MNHHHRRRRRRVDTGYCLCLQACQCVLLGPVIIWLVCVTAVLWARIYPDFYIDALPLVGTGPIDTGLVGRLSFVCDASDGDPHLTFSLNYRVPEGDRVERIHLEAANPSLNGGGGALPLPLPLCRNDALDPGNTAGGPHCPAADPICPAGAACERIGTLRTGIGAAVVTVTGGIRLCEQLAANRLRIRVFSAAHPTGIALGDLVQKRIS
jgi:hypothetical protein